MRSLKRFALLALLALLSLAGLAQSAFAATPSVRVSEDYACALSHDGNVSCWGANQRGQLGDGTYVSSSTPVPVANVSNAVQIDVGIYDACALIADGTVKCWGSNSYSTLGQDGINSVNGKAVAITGISGATNLSVGENTNCVIVTGGTVKCWGGGYKGLLGDGLGTPQTSTPVNVAGLGAAATDIGVGDFHACAVAGGALKCWGWNLFKQIENSATTQFNAATLAGGLSSGVALASAGYYHTCAVMTSGAVRCWGLNGDGQDGGGVTGNSTSPQNTNISSGATSIGYGQYHRCALVGDSARCWGENYDGAIGVGDVPNDKTSPVTPTGLESGVSSIDAGGSNSCAIVNKVVKCWGAKGSGVLGNGQSSNHNTPVSVLGVTGATEVSVGADHSCAVVSAAVKCWGQNWFGQLGNGGGPGTTAPVSASTFTGSASSVAGSDGTTCAVLAGAVKCVGYGANGQLGNNGVLSDTSAVSTTGLAGGVSWLAGHGSTYCAIPTSIANIGRVLCWGSNYSSMLGRGAGQNYVTLSQGLTPGLVSNIPAATATWVTVGNNHACAVVSGGLKCWGYSSYGEVNGDASVGGEFPNSVTPGGISSGVAGFAHTVAVSYNNTCYITSPAGAVNCFGRGDTGSNGNGSTSDSDTPVQVSGISSGASGIAGSRYTFCALVSGTIKCWGWGEYGELGNGTNGQANTPVTVSGITNAIGVVGSDGTFCAILVGGSLKCWGEGEQGQMGDGLPLLVSTPVDVTGLSLFAPNPLPPAPYAAQKIKPTFKLNGKVKKSGTKIKVPLKLYYAAPAGSNPATVCTGTTTLSVKISKKKTSKFKAKFKRKGANCSYTGTVKLPKSFKGKKTKFKISMPGNADVLKYSSTKTLKLK